VGGLEGAEDELVLLSSLWSIHLCWPTHWDACEPCLVYSLSLYTNSVTRFSAGRLLDFILFPDMEYFSVLM